MELRDAADHLVRHVQGVLAVPRPDGAPHVTRVVQHFDGATCRVSLTDDRVKTGLLRGAGVASMHVRGDTDWTWVTLESTASLSAVAEDVDDPVADQLLAVYEAIAGPHDDPADFRRAMVAERRLVLTLSPQRVYGQLPETA